jgi:hypothetical protein
MASVLLFTAEAVSALADNGALILALPTVAGAASVAIDCNLKSAILSLFGQAMC